MKKIAMSVAAGGLLAFASVAQAGEPVQLSDVQLDQVSAGATALSTATGVAGGNFSSFTDVLTDASADSVSQIATASADSLSVAQSALGFMALATSSSSSSSTLP